MAINENVSLNFCANTFNTDIPFSEAHTLLFNSFHGEKLEIFQCPECDIEFTKSDTPHGFTPAKIEIGVLGCFCGECFDDHIECEKCGLATNIVNQNECTHCGHNNRDSIPLYV